MKTTVDIQDLLLDRAKRYARRSQQPLRAVIEEGLRRVLAEERTADRFELIDASVGDPDVPDPLERYSWQDLRAEIYGDSPQR